MGRWGIHFSNLFERASEDGEDGAVFIPVNLLLKFNELLKAEDSDRKDAVNFEFVGVDKKVLVGEVFADCAEQIEVAVGRSQIEVATTAEMAHVGSKAPVRVHSKYGIQMFQHRQKASNIFGASLMHDVEVERSDGYTPGDG